MFFWVKNITSSFSLGRAMSLDWAGGELTGRSFLLSCLYVSVNGGRVVTVSGRPSFWDLIAERYSTPCTTVENYSREDYVYAKKSPYVLIEDKGAHDFMGYDLPSSLEFDIDESDLPY